MRGASRERFTALVVAKLESEGFELLADVPATEPASRRVLITGRGGWLSLTEEDLTTAHDWAAFLADGLGDAALAIHTWEDESVSTFTVHHPGKKPEVVGVPAHVRRDKKGVLRLPLGPLARFVPLAKRASLTRGVVLDEGGSGSDDREEVVYVDTDASVEAVAAAIDLPNAFLEASNDDDDDDPEGAQKLELIFRRRAAAARGAVAATAPKRPPVVPPRKRRQADVARRIDDYSERSCAVGWVGFDAPTPDAVAEAIVIAADLVEALAAFARFGTANDGFMVIDPAGPPIEGSLVTTRGRSKGASAWRECVRRLAAGAAIDLYVDPRFAHAWIVHEPRSEDAPFERPRFTIGFAVPRPHDQANSAHLARAVDALVVAAAARPDCIGAVATAQGVLLSRDAATFAYESLAGTTAGHRHAAWLREHVRAPGWRMVIPPPAAERLAKKWPSGVRATKVAAGLFVSTRSGLFDEDGALTEAVERHILPAVGSEAEADALTPSGS